LGPGCFLIAAGAAGGLLVAPRRPPGIPPPDAMWFELDELVFDIGNKQKPRDFLPGALHLRDWHDGRGGPRRVLGCCVLLLLSRFTAAFGT